MVKLINPVKRYCDYNLADLSLSSQPVRYYDIGRHINDTIKVYSYYRLQPTLSCRLGPSKTNDYHKAGIVFTIPTGDGDSGLVLDLDSDPALYNWLDQLDTTLATLLATKGANYQSFVLMELDCGGLGRAKTKLVRILTGQTLEAIESVTELVSVSGRRRKLLSRGFGIIPTDPLLLNIKLDKLVAIDGFYQAVFVIESGLVLDLTWVGWTGELVFNKVGSS